MISQATATPPFPTTLLPDSCGPLSPATPPATWLGRGLMGLGLGVAIGLGLLVGPIPLPEDLAPRPTTAYPAPTGATAAATRPEVGGRYALTARVASRDPRTGAYADPKPLGPGMSLGGGDQIAVSFTPPVDSAIYLLLISDHDGPDDGLVDLVTAAGAPRRYPAGVRVTLPPDSGAYQLDANPGQEALAFLALPAADPALELDLAAAQADPGARQRLRARLAGDLAPLVHAIVFQHLGAPLGAAVPDPD